ncbi:MAG: amidohydrolase [Candidatus Acidiferrales bacterium]
MVFAGLSALLVAPSSQAQQKLEPLAEKELPSLVALYKKLHAAPELSHHEKETAAAIARELRAAGFEVTENVGKFDDASLTSYGLVGVMRNGEGPTVLIRTDLDGLPVTEATGLPYASKVRAKNPQGQDVGVMHACGHDMHMSSFVGTARLLAALKNQWRGTVVMVGQPAEEVVTGAKALLADGLYTRFPKPDFALALHDWTDYPAGTIAVVPGFALSSANEVDITVRGIGAHGSRPEASKDPIVLAAQIVLALQTIVSREVSPFDPAVVTVGSIHGGSKHNIISDEVKLQLTVRSYQEVVRSKVLAAIERIAVNTARAAGLPDDRLPLVTVNKIFAPATYNDPALTARVAAAAKRVLGDDKVVEGKPVMGSEDIGHFGGPPDASGRRIPVCMFFVGGADPAKLEAARKGAGPPIPSLHSPLWAPIPEPTIRTGVLAMTAATLDLLAKP